MQLTDFQYLLPKRRYVILCKQVCFVPISPIFSCQVTFLHAYWLHLYFNCSTIGQNLDILNSDEIVQVCSITKLVS